MSIQQRDEKTMLDLILRVAHDNDSIKAVILNGSRVSPSAKKDAFQDYDIIYLVTHVLPFVENTHWLDPLGEKLILQKPDEMSGAWEHNKERFAFLMQFNDGNRIDLTLQAKKTFHKQHKDSQSVALLDKENILDPLPPPSDKDYLPTPPTKKAFMDCCNEFFWVSTSVAKGIARNELTYTKHLFEQIVKNEFVRLLTWQAGEKTHFKKPIGKHGKYLADYVASKTWKKFQTTYVGTKQSDVWEALFTLCDLFENIAVEIASTYHYPYPTHEYKAVIDYLHTVKNRSPST